jgi:peptide/nickel transport system substrate-binding protein
VFKRQVSKVSNNQFIELTQNPAYWGRSLSAAEIKANPYLDPGHVQNVIVQVRSDELARITDLQTGAAQIVQIDPVDFRSLAANPEYSYYKPPASIGYINDIAFNTKVYPTNITDVRLAIAHAINYTDIIQRAYNGLVAPIVPPEVPMWPDFYNLGNYSAPYQYNLTLAKQYLAKANITNFPTLNFVTYVGCDACANEAQIVQADLAQIGINVNIQVETTSSFFSVRGSYSNEVQNAATLGELSMTPSYAAVNVTPAEFWIDLASNRSIVGNLAVYSNPVVEKCVNAFFSTTDTTQIQSLCRAAQTQIYNDAPYAFLGVNLSWELNGAGSVFWKNSVIKSAYFDILFSASGYQPVFNIVTFVGSP